MTANTQPEALRLADLIDQYNTGVCSQAIYEDYARAAAELRRLHAECEALRADAERYRWLRDECSGEPRVGGVCPAIHLYALQGVSEDAWNETAVATNHLGETIDAARAAIKEQSNDH